MANFLTKNLKDLVPSSIKCFLKYELIFLITKIFLGIPKHTSFKNNYRKKILFVTHLENIGGVEKMLLQAIKTLHKSNKNDISILYTATKKRLYVLELIRKLGTKTIEINKPKSLIEHIKISRRIFSLTKNYNIVFVANFPFFLDSWLYVKQFNNDIKLICWLQGFNHNMENINIAVKYHYLFQEIIVLNKFMASFFNSKKIKTYTLPNGVEYISNTTKLNKKKLLIRLGIPNGKFICTYIGRLDQDKNPFFLLKIAERVRHKKIFFCIVGSGDLEKQLKEQAKKLGLKNILFLGFKKDIAPLLKISNTLLLVSKNEGLPLAVLEAMSLKTPVISSNYPGVSELLENRKTGLIVPLQVESFYSAINLLFYNKKLYKSIQKNAFKQYLNNYSINSFNRGFRNLYRNL